MERAEIKVVDDAVRPALAKGITDYLKKARWEWGHHSSDEAAFRFWWLPLEEEVLALALLQELKIHFQPEYPRDFQIVRMYANGQTYGLDGSRHQDSEHPQDFTVLYFPVPHWEPSWGGETVFFGPEGAPKDWVAPRPNRAMIFPSHYWHLGRGPNRECIELRMTVAYKLRAK